MWEKVLLPKVKGTACFAAKVHRVKKAEGAQGRKKGGTFTVEMLLILCHNSNSW